MRRYDPGDTASLRREVRDPDDVLTDATVAFTYYAPGADDPAAASVTHNGVGIYDVSISDLMDGVYRGRWDVSGPVDDIATVSFYVAEADAELPPLASFDLLARKLGATAEDFDDAERARGEYLLDEASELIRDAAGKTWVNDDNVPADVPRRVARICVAAAARAFDNPEGLNQRVIGDSSKGYDRSGREGGEVVYLTDAERADVVKAAGGGAGFESITLTSPYSGAIVDPWVAVNAE